MSTVIYSLCDGCGLVIDDEKDMHGNSAEFIEVRVIGMGNSHPSWMDRTAAIRHYHREHTPEAVRNMTPEFDWTSKSPDS